ncbi:MAG: hypothetical protein HOV81_41510 [Kofleriaceae bacterium]|nr:hypothetical protein [Kofleriaceae bacterium]
MLVCVVGCGKSAKECKTDAEALATLLRETPHEPEMFVLAGRHLVARPDLTDKRGFGYAPVLDITKAGFAMQGEPIAQAELSTKLATIHDQGAQHWMGRGSDPDRIYFAIDGDVTWDRVVMAFEAAEAAGLVKEAFVFEYPSKPLTPPPRSAVDAELDKLQADPDAANKASRLAEMMSTRVKRCKSLQQLFGGVAAVEGEDKADFIITGLAEALVECECNVDMPELRSIMWRVLATQHQTRVYEFAPRVRDETIAFPATTTWADASKKLAPPLRGAKLAVQ